MNFKTLGPDARAKVAAHRAWVAKNKPITIVKTSIAKSVVNFVKGLIR
jgi:hypothetical protein